MKPYPENKPEEAGYYMTYYYNPLEDKKFYKALGYSVIDGKWIGPISLIRKNMEAEVLFFLPESRNDFYVPCETWCNGKTITYKQE